MKDRAFVFTEHTDARTCPACARVLDGATGVSLDPDDPRPRICVDAVTVCVYCGTILVVTTIGFRIATDAELDGVDPKLRRLLMEFPRQRGGPTQ